MKSCPRCGMECADDAANCTLCGTALPIIRQDVAMGGYPLQGQPSGQQYQGYLQQNGGQPQPPYSQQYQGYPQQNGQMPYQQPYQNGPGYGYQPPQQKKYSSLVLGIIGIIFALILPLVTYGCSIPGIVLGLRDVRAGYGKLPWILNIVAVILAGINSLAGVYLYLSLLS